MKLQPQVSKSDQFSTKDFPEASFLLVRGMELLGLEHGPGHFWFVFADRNQCEALTQQFWSGEGMVSAKHYSLAMRELKSRLHAHR